MLTIENLLQAFTLEVVGADRYEAPNADAGHGVIFGGQLLGQSVVAGAAAEPAKRVKTVHTVFARAGAPDAPVALVVDRMHSGRAMASSTVTIAQGDRLIARSQVLLSAEEPDFIHHAAPVLDVPGPDECPVAGESGEGGEGGGAWQIRVVGGVDLGDPEQVGPPELDVWTRFVGAPDDATLAQALLAFATDGFLIGTAMRPHPGVGQSQAHRTLSTGVLSHTLTFHEPCSAGDWMLLSHRSTHAGGGRCYGTAQVFQGGRLVASFVQDAMIRPSNADAGPTKL